MAFLLLVIFAYVVAVFAVARVVGVEAKRHYRKTILFGEAAVAFGLVGLVGGWRSWDIPILGTGQVRYGAELVEPSIFIVLFSSVLALISFVIEWRARR